MIIEDKKYFSELINYAADFNGAVIVKAEPLPASFTEILFNSKENSPEKVLSSNNFKGNCWGFQGNNGEITIKTAKSIYPQHFTIIHTNSVNFDSAPRKICVYRVFQAKEALLSCFDFFIPKGLSKADFIKTFECETNCFEKTSEFKFKILSNHGSDFTCVYQILIHGEPITLSY